jgi:hypothetical protein
MIKYIHYEIQIMMVYTLHYLLLITQKTLIISTGRYPYFSVLWNYIKERISEISGAMLCLSTGNKKFMK